MKRYTIEQFMDTTKIGGSAFTSDEKAILFHSNKSGIYNVYRVSITGGAAEQLTHSTKESTYLVTAFPHDARFLYTYDKGGNENSHLYLRELDGKERDLTPGEKTKASFLKWSADRKSFFFATNARDPKFFDVYEMKIADLKPTLVYKNDAGYDFADISDDRRFIAFGKSGDSTADSDVYLYNVATKEMKNLTAHKGDVQNIPQAFAPGFQVALFPLGRRQRVPLSGALRSRQQPARSRRENEMGYGRHVFLAHRQISHHSHKRRRAHKGEDCGDGDWSSGRPPDTAAWRHYRDKDLR